jgi:DtxR family Mn-dependent transcriptional regulator
MTMPFDEIMQTFPAASDYLSAIYLIDRDNGTVANSRLAAWLRVSRPAVSQAVTRLKKLGLITQERYSDIVLTDLGREFARKMLRRHYLLEHFLVNNLNMSWHEIDEEAKRLQNSISDNFEDKMFQVLGKPQTCPHGNPIPGVDGEAEILGAPPLSQAAEGDRVRFIRITEEGEEAEGLLDFVYERKINLGCEFEILKKSEDAVTVKVFETGGGILHERVEIPGAFARFLTWTPA